MGFPSPGGKKWSNQAVYRILKDQTHLGKIVFGKQKGSGHKNRKTRPLKEYDPENWIVVDGLHKPVKKQAEHEKILELLAKRRLIPKPARAGAYTLSGLVRCAQCGHTMGYTRNGKNTKEYLKKCQSRDEYGNRTCENPGIDSEVVIEEIFSELGRYEEGIKRMGEEIDTGETELLEVAIEKKKEELEKNNDALKMLIVMREGAEISREKFLERKEAREKDSLKMKREIEELQERIRARESATNEEKLKNIQEFREKWEGAENSREKNQFLSLVLDCIYYERKGDNIRININFH